MQASDDGPVTVIITYKIKDGVTRDEYRKWSRERDQPMASSQPGITRYEIFEVERSEDGGEPWTDVVEVIEAESLDAWLAVDRAPEMKEVYEEFLAISKPETTETAYAHRIEP